jgi:RES domain-containing protein
MLEKLVHTGRRVPRHQVCVVFDVPDDMPVRMLHSHEVAGWDQPDMLASRAAGDAWLGGNDSALLLVPSVVQDVERNALINPLHPESARIRLLGIEPVRWDARLFQASPRPTP